MTKKKATKPSNVSNAKTRISKISTDAAKRVALLMRLSKLEDRVRHLEDRLTTQNFD